MTRSCRNALAEDRERIIPADIEVGGSTVTVMFFNLVSFMPYIWISAAVFALIFETLTMKYTALCILLSALGALAASLFGASVPVSCLVFFALCVLLIVLRYTVLRRFLDGLRAPDPDPAELVGMTGVVTQAVDNRENSGRIRLKGREWRACSSKDAATFAVGSLVTLLEYDPDYERFTCGEAVSPDSRPADRA